MDAEREIERIRREYARRRREVPADRYSPDRPEIRLERADIERTALRLLDAQGQRPLDTSRILDVGCGTGHWLARMAGWGARPEHLTGIDLRPEAIRAAVEACPGMSFAVARADHLPFDDASFDLVSQFVVFSSILDPDLRAAGAREMWRVLAPGGAVLSFDMRYPNPWNRQVAPVPRRELRRLFPEGRIESRTLVLLPPVARTLAPWSPLLCRLLVRLPPLRSHLLAVIKKA
jgi:SAM-dependent methyltransferase